MKKNVTRLTNNNLIVQLFRTLYVVFICRRKFLNGFKYVDINKNVYIIVYFPFINNQ